MHSGLLGSEICLMRKFLRFLAGWTASRGGGRHKYKTVLKFVAGLTDFMGGGAAKIQTCPKVFGGVGEIVYYSITKEP